MGEFRFQNRPLTHAQWVLRGLKGSGTSMVSVKSVLSSGLKPKFTYTTLGALWPLTLMAIEVPKPFKPLRTRGAWKRLSLFPFLIWITQSYFYPVMWCLVTRWCWLCLSCDSSFILVLSVLPICHNAPAYKLQLYHNTATNITNIINNNK